MKRHQPRLATYARVWPLPVTSQCRSGFTDRCHQQSQTSQKWRNATERFHRRHAAGVDKRTATREEFNKQTKSQFQPHLATAVFFDEMSVYSFGRTFAERLHAAHSAKYKHIYLQPYPLHFASKIVAMRLALPDRRYFTGLAGILLLI